MVSTNFEQTQKEARNEPCEFWDKHPKSREDQVQRSKVGLLGWWGSEEYQEGCCHLKEVNEGKA